MSNTRRTATVITKTPCTMLKLLSRDFSRFLEIVPEVKDAFSRVMNVRIAQTLRNIPFFRAVYEHRPDSKLNTLGAMFLFEHHTTGEVVCTEGAPWDKFVLIVDGVVEVSKSIQTPSGQERVVLETLTKNQWFGENQLIKDTPMLASVTCRDDCLFLSVTRDKFTRFIKVAPEIVDHFSALVTWRTAAMLRGIDLFMGGLKEDKPWSKLELLCSMFEYEAVYKEVELMREGETREDTNKFYIIQQGSVRLTRGLADPPQPDEAETKAPPPAVVVEEKAAVSRPSSLSPRYVGAVVRVRVAALVAVHPHHTVHHRRDAATCSAVHHRAHQGRVLQRPRPAAAPPASPAAAALHPHADAVRVPDADAGQVPSVPQGGAGDPRQPRTALPAVRGRRSGR